MVASTIVGKETMTDKRKRKNSQVFNKEKQFDENFPAKMLNFSKCAPQSQKIWNSKSKSFSDDKPPCKDMERNSYQTKPNDSEDDNSSLGDYAECSETEMEIQKQKGVCLNDAISAIMSKGGALDSNGALLRPNLKKKRAKKKKKTKKIADVSTLGKTNNDIVPNNSTFTTTNGKSVQGKCYPVWNQDGSKLINHHITFPDNIRKSKPLEKHNITEKEKFIDNAGSKSKNAEKLDTFLKNKSKESVESPKKKKKLKMSNNTSAQVQDEIISKDDLNSSTSENKIDINAIHLKYADKSFRKMLKAAWRGSDVADSELPDGAQVLQQPFNCARLPHFLDSSDDLLGRLKEELSQLNMSPKNNDMYKFHQSVELPHSGACLELCEFFEGPVRRWLRKTTGIPFNDKVALSASLYLHSDVLLCHDDELEGRRVAFILYLTGGEEGGDSCWGPQDGGSLDLFDCDESGRPQRVVQRIYPANNTFAFFEVSPASFHQVAEVLSPHKVRLSVNGWFHGPDIERPSRPHPVPRHFFSPGDVELEEIYSWISPMFRTESLQNSVRKQFAKDSQIYLEDFVPEEKYAELCEAFKEAPKDSWSWTGPPNRAHYQVAPSLDALPVAVQKLLRVLQSEAGLLVMAQLTGLPLHPLAPSDGSDDSESDQEECSDEDGSEMETSDDEENKANAEEDGSKGKKNQSKSKKNSSGDSEDEVMMEDEAKEEKQKTLKEILKRHKKMSKSILKHSKVVGEEPPKKKRRKKSKVAAQKAERALCGMDQVWVPDVGLGSGQKGAGRNGTSSSMGRVYSSVRRIGHGCYSLILDDDNEEDTSCSGVTLPAVVDGTKGTSVVDDGRKGSSQEDAEKNADSSIDCDKSKKKKKGKKSCGKMEDRSSKKTLEGGSCAKGEEKKATKAGGSSSDGGDKFVLDLVYFVDVPEDWQESWGGYTAYVAKGEREELLTVSPRPNTLALVYRDADTFSFLKHVNCRAAGWEAGGQPRHYHALVCQYK